MQAKLISYIGRHHIALLALFIALGGTSYAAVNLPANSVGTKQLRSKAVTPAKVHPRTVRLFKGQKGDPGSDAQFNGASAGGDLTGAYPSPFFRPAEGWHDVPEAQTSGAPDAFYCLAPGAFGCQYGWLNSDAANDNPAGYYKDRAGVVHLRGVVKLNFTCLMSTCQNADENQIFTLPPGYRPEHKEVQPAVLNASASRMHVHPDGRVVPGVGVANQDELSLDGISFRAAN